MIQHYEWVWPTQPNKGSTKHANSVKLIKTLEAIEVVKMGRKCGIEEKVKN